VIDYTQPKEQVFFDAAMMICSNSSEHMVYELGWYISQIAYGMDLLTMEGANDFFVVLNGQLHIGQRREEQMDLLVRSLREKFDLDGGKRRLTFLNGVFNEKMGRLTPEWVA
jgi:hypothetical protein